MATLPGWTWPLATLLEVHDGDTVRLSIDNGFGSRAVEWIRLQDVWCPELSAPGGPLARDITAAWFNEHAPAGLVTVTTYRVTPLELRFRQSFTRYIGVICAPDQAELNAYLTGLGYVAA
jgi:hypothetical protein